ncbi:MAG: glycosyltransferase family 39 protein, partial [Candidatus Moranbacteria bacterium]|nr:glycosyltransferase family 39 protein [Candidatus Moranbacteria bacterium]
MDRQTTILKRYLSKLDWKSDLFFLVIAVGIFLRVWHFSDWLFFKLDQARDSFLILQAYEKGMGYLPLLGARAGGTSLLLGPAYYYFQYISLALTHNIHPTAFAYPDLFFSILAIPVFYLFLKKYFSRDWSLILASVLAVCFFAIEYSRFAWNPNPLPFFTVLFFLSLLNIFDEKEKRKTLWTSVAAISLSIASQLHFLAFLALPAIALIFLLFQWKDARKYIGWKKTAIFVGIFLLSYLPWILNDFEKKWKNARLFWKAVLTKLFAATLLSDIVSGLDSFAQSWLTILTGYVNSGKILALTIFGRYLAVNKILLIAICVWALFIIPSLALNWKLFRKEKDPMRKKFLLLVLIWFLVFFAAYIPIGNQLRPRFFMATLVLPIIYLGFDLVWLKKILGKIWLPVVAGILTVVFAGNLAGTYLWFQEIKATQTKDRVNVKRTFIFKGDDGVVLWHIEKAAQYMVADCGGKKIYYASYPVYLKPLDYVLRLRGANAIA